MYEPSPVNDLLCTVFECRFGATGMMPDRFTYSHNRLRVYIGKRRYQTHLAAFQYPCKSEQEEATIDVVDSAMNRIEQQYDKDQKHKEQSSVL